MTATRGTNHVLGDRRCLALSAVAESGAMSSPRRTPAFKSAGHLHVPGSTRCRSETPGQWHSRYFFPITGPFPALPTIRDHHRPTRPRQRFFSLSFRFYYRRNPRWLRRCDRAAPPPSQSCCCARLFDSPPPFRTVSHIFILHHAPSFASHN